LPGIQGSRAARAMHGMQALQRRNRREINRNRGALIMEQEQEFEEWLKNEEQEFEEWLKNDWFTSGETSWEEYWDNQDEDEH
jgi:hypothetical protein